MANRDRLTSLGSCTDLRIQIEGESFVINCYGLALRSFDMVLSIQWLNSLGPILCDFARRTMAFVRHGHQVRWSADTSGGVQPSPHTTTIDNQDDELMEELLLRFAALFETSIGLPPTHSCYHQIRLLPGAASVAVLSYRYAHARKN
jgi:hypothetical protein